MPEPRLRWPFLIVLAAVLGTTGARGQDLDAGKTGPQLFAQDCSACHRSPQGLAKNMSSGSLVGFLRQHYTSSSTSAGVVAAYVLANAGNSRAAIREIAQYARAGEFAVVDHCERIPSNTEVLSLLASHRVVPLLSH